MEIYSALTGVYCLRPQIKRSRSSAARSRETLALPSTLSLAFNSISIVKLSVRFRPIC